MLALAASYGVGCQQEHVKPGEYGDTSRVHCGSADCIGREEVR